ncbi:hypothetical protein MKX01_011570 [Papaver californicum]|nr:hypothetical protein MKX01_011570 [Papaver californicum]
MLASSRLLIRQLDITNLEIKRLERYRLNPEKVVSDRILFLKRELDSSKSRYQLLKESSDKILEIKNKKISFLKIKKEALNYSSACPEAELEDLKLKISSTSTGVVSPISR